MPGAISGKTGTITFGGTNFCVQSWEVSVNTEAVDTSNTCTNGFRDNIDSITGSELTASGPVLVGAVYPTSGSTVTVVLGNTAASPTPLYSGVYLVNSIEYTMAVDGAYNFSISATSTV